MHRRSALCKFAGNKGFMLVDVLVAILLLSITLVPIAGMFIQAMKVDTMAKDYTVAANLAQKQLELLKTKSPDYWTGLTLPCIIPWQDITQLPAPRYQLTTHGVSLVDESLIQVTVIVLWQEGGKNCNLQFVTFYPKS